MVEPVKLLKLVEETGYPLAQHNGQRKFGPPTDWTGPPPPKGSEVFVGKLPREIFEDELVPLFMQIGKIYEMRLMMDFSGSNRGYAFVTYTSRAEAYKAVKELNGYAIRPGRLIGVVKSVDNCRLFVGGIPKNKSKEEVLQELSRMVAGIVDVILYKNCFDKRLNRGFAFVEFASHRAAAMARRTLIPGCVKLWDHDVMVDWAEPEPDVDDEQMNKVKVLYGRNFQINTPPDTIKAVFEAAINSKIERIKKINDYAFIHFYEREHAEAAIRNLQNVEIDGSNIEIRWAKPVDRELYRIQKMNRGNSKFNNNSDFSQTLMLYKNQLDKKEYANSPKDDEGIGSACAGSSCASPIYGNNSNMLIEQYPLGPAKLDAMCRKYNWAPPIFNYETYMDSAGKEMWACSVKLPYVYTPLLTVPRSIGPLVTPVCYSKQQAQIKASENALHAIETLKSNLSQQPVQTHVCSSFLQPMPNCVNVPYEYINSSMYASRPPVAVPIPAVWRSA